MSQEDVRWGIKDILYERYYNIRIIIIYCDKKKTSINNSSKNNMFKKLNW